VLLFRTVAGGRDFNPIALVFARFAFVERFRFWQPFRDAKHGNNTALRRMESEVLARLNTSFEKHNERAMSGWWLCQALIRQAPER
jgi:hypothetical protein